MTQYAQGDCLFTKGAMPAGAKPSKEPRIVARGEATGHNHVLDGDATLFTDDAGRDWVVVGENGGAVVHTSGQPPEHEVVIFEPGEWLVDRQVEPDPMLGVRRAQD